MDGNPVKIWLDTVEKSYEDRTPTLKGDGQLITVRPVIHDAFERYGRALFRKPEAGRLAFRS